MKITFFLKKLINQKKCSSNYRIPLNQKTSNKKISTTCHKSTHYQSKTDISSTIESETYCTTL